MSSQNSIDAAVLQSLDELDPAGTHQIRDTLIQLFGTDTAKRIADAIAARDQANWKKLGEIAHAMRSSAANLGAVKMGAACHALEESVKAGNFTEAPLLFAAVELEFQGAVAELAEIQKKS